jgi:phosphohistidine phosphatase
MRLYLVQHGKAKSKEEDPDRPLAQEGQEETQLMAEMASRLDVGIREIRHSGKTRAEQTATIFGRALSLMGQVKAVSGLGATGDVQPVAEEMAAQDEPVMLVGHKPFMPRLAGWLVNGDIEGSPVDFRNSGIVCLERTNGDWQVRWHLSPG